jgi:hypothetical protein
MAVAAIDADSAAHAVTRRHAAAAGRAPLGGRSHTLGSGAKQEMDMKKIKLQCLACAALCTIAAACNAGDGELTRSQVIAEMQAARADGTLGVFCVEDSGSAFLSRMRAPTGVTRAQVQAELSQARASGALRAFTSEDSGSSWLALHASPSTLAREQVRAEVLAARASGELGAMLGEDSGASYLAAVASRRARAKLVAPQEPPTARIETERDLQSGRAHAAANTP